MDPNFEVSKVVLARQVQETFTDWPDTESSAVIYFFIGCCNKCVGCQNSHLADIWSAYIDLKMETSPFIGYDKNNFGMMNFAKVIYETAKKYNTNKVIFQGGDPLFINNREFVKDFLRYNKDRKTNGEEDYVDICIYTGYDIDDVKKFLDSELDLVSFIKCGRYDANNLNSFSGTQKSEDKIVFASKNQKLYNGKFELLSKDGIYTF